MGDVWITWVTDPSHTNLSNNDAATSTWTTWVSTANATPISNIIVPSRRVVQVAAVPLETPEQLALRRQQQEQYRRELQARVALEERIRQEASQRAEQLLLSVMSEPQRQQYARDRWLVVRGRSGRLYRVRRGRVANVDVLDASGRVLHRLCCHPIGEMPDEDVMIAQLMHLTHDDDAFCRTANVHAVLAAERVVLPAVVH